MVSRMKPIDAIRRELNRRGHRVGVDFNRRDACDLLGEHRDTSMKELCHVLGVEYDIEGYDIESKDRETKFLINIGDIEDVIEFRSRNVLWRALLGGRVQDSIPLDDIIESQFVMLLNRKRYVVSDTPQRDLDPRYNFRHKMMFIRQTMRERGFEGVTHKTNKKDINAMLGLPLLSSKKKIYETLDVVYFKTRGMIHRPWRRVTLTNISDPSHTVEFRSVAEAGRELNIHSREIQMYYNNSPSLTVPYEGHTFRLSIHE